MICTLKQNTSTESDSIFLSLKSCYHSLVQVIQGHCEYKNRSLHYKRQVMLQLLIHLSVHSFHYIGAFIAIITSLLYGKSLVIHCSPHFLFILIVILYICLFPHTWGGEQEKSKMHEYTLILQTQNLYTTKLKILHKSNFFLQIL